MSAKAKTPAAAPEAGPLERYPVEWINRVKVIVCVLLQAEQLINDELAKGYRTLLQPIAVAFEEGTVLAVATILFDGPPSEWGVSS